MRTPVAVGNQFSSMAAPTTLIPPRRGSGAARFALAIKPPFGAGKLLSFAGRCWLRLAGVLISLHRARISCDHIARDAGAADVQNARALLATSLLVERDLGVS